MREIKSNHHQSVCIILLKVGGTNSLHYNIGAFYMLSSNCFVGHMQVAKWKHVTFGVKDAWKFVKRGQS